VAETHTNGKYGGHRTVQRERYKDTLIVNEKKKNIRSLPYMLLMRMGKVTWAMQPAN
jgi:hypothetical protein